MQEIAANFFANILYKTLFATNFIGNTCEFYNFVGNNYSRRNYLLIKIIRKNNKKESFFANFFNKFVRKFACNTRIFSSDSKTELTQPNKNKDQMCMLTKILYIGLFNIKVTFIYNNFLKSLKNIKNIN